jgi:hypothetical protein
MYVCMYVCMFKVGNFTHYHYLRLRPRLHVHVDGQQNELLDIATA